MSKAKGFIALVSVAVLMAVGLTVTAGLLIRASGESRLAVTDDYQIRAQAAATACAERALMELKSSLTYAGNQTLQVGSDTCSILLVGGVGNLNRTLDTTSTVSGVESKLHLMIDSVNPDMTVSSWQDVVSF